MSKWPPTVTHPRRLWSTISTPQNDFKSCGPDRHERIRFWFSLHLSAGLFSTVFSISIVISYSFIFSRASVPRVPQFGKDLVRRAVSDAFMLDFAIWNVFNVFSVFNVFNMFNMFNVSMSVRSSLCFTSCHRQGRQCSPSPWPSWHWLNFNSSNFR